MLKSVVEMAEKSTMQTSKRNQLCVLNICFALAINRKLEELNLHSMTIGTNLDRIMF